jgi:hypothetical protein
MLVRIHHKLESNEFHMGVVPRGRGKQGPRTQLLRAPCVRPTSAVLWLDWKGREG